MKKRVLLDIDGVVLNLVEGVRILLERDGITFYPENVVTYNFNGDIGCEKTKVYAKFNDPELYKVMPFMDSSKEAVDLLKRHCDVYVYTAATNNPEVIKMRKQFINKLGLKGQVYIDRKPVLDGFDALFDDCLGVHKTWIEDGANIKHFLINATYNQKIEANASYDQIWDQLIRCDNLMDAVQKYIKQI